jgi:hypothetical protein
MTQCIQMIDVFQEGALECCVLAVISLQRTGNGTENADGKSHKEPDDDRRSKLSKTVICASKATEIWVDPFGCCSCLG